MRPSNLLSLALLVVASGCATPSVSAPASGAPGFVTLNAGSGTSVRAYAAGREDAKAGVLVVHDYFGISDFTLAACERLARLGYRVIAVDLYNSKSAQTDEAAGQLMQAFQAQDRKLTDRTLQAALDALKRPGRRIATLGFSMGGIESLHANLNDPDAVQATAIIYGFGFGQLGASAMSRLKSPVLTVTGALDDGSLRASLDLLKGAREVHQPIETLVVPDVGHAYAQPLFQAGKGYSADATRMTWRAVEDFFARQLTAP
jgi:carboxymethylenebutenolidase